MLNLPEWREEPLIVHFFSSSHLELQSGGPPLPPHMRVDVAPIEVSRINCTHTSSMKAATHTALPEHCKASSPLPAQLNSLQVVQALPTVVDDDFDLEDPHDGGCGDDDDGSSEGGAAAWPVKTSKRRGEHHEHNPMAHACAEDEFE